MKRLRTWLDKAMSQPSFVATKRTWGLFRSRDQDLGSSVFRVEGKGV